MQTEIFLLDHDYTRATKIRMLFSNKGMQAATIATPESAVDIGDTSDGAVVLAHSDFLNSAFTQMAYLMQVPKIVLLFYSTDEKDRPFGVPLIPDEIDLLIVRLKEVTAIRYRKRQ